jgi:DNA-binding LacI/PurR family transcriptional regulator
MSDRVVQGNCAQIGGNRAVNIHDLARHLNVSIGTVSRALNGRSDVSAETRRRVLEAAEELGYSPNQSGRSLRQGATGMIGFMVVTNRERAAKGEAFFMAVFDGLQSYLAGRNLDLVVHLCSADQDPYAYVRRVVERRLADGIIISDTQRVDPRIDYLMKRKIPFVAFGRSDSGGDHPWLDLDFEGVAEQAVDLLVTKGHRRIAVATADNEINYGYLFVDACRASLTRRGIALGDELVLREPLSETGGLRVGERLLGLAERPTAILLVDNKMATGLYHRFYEAGIVPGRDVAVIGFDDSPQGAFLTPALTRFHVSLSDLGRTLGEHLVAAMDARAAGHKPAPLQTIWPMQLIPGESDGPMIEAVAAE